MRNQLRALDESEGYRVESMNTDGERAQVTLFAKPARPSAVPLLSLPPPRRRGHYFRRLDDLFDDWQIRGPARLTAAGVRRARWVLAGWQGGLPQLRGGGRFSRRVLQPEQQLELRGIQLLPRAAARALRAACRQAISLRSVRCWLRRCAAPAGRSEVAPVFRPELMEIKLWRRGVRW